MDRVGLEFPRGAILPDLIANPLKHVDAFMNDQGDDLSGIVSVIDTIGNRDDAPGQSLLGMYRVKGSRVRGVIGIAIPPYQFEVLPPRLFPRAEAKVDREVNVIE